MIDGSDYEVPKQARDELVSMLKSWRERHNIPDEDLMYQLVAIGAKIIQALNECSATEALAFMAKLAIDSAIDPALEDV